MDQIVKRSNEKFPIYANFQSVLMEDETLESYVVACVSGADGSNTKSTIVDSDEIDEPRIKIVIKSGTDGETHKISVQATTSLSNVYEKDVLLIINDDPDYEFIKQPSEITPFSIDFEKDLESGDYIDTEEVTLCDIDGVDLATEMVLDAESDETETIVTVGGGENGQLYISGIAVTTHDGYVYSKSVLIRVEEM